MTPDCPDDPEFRAAIMGYAEWGTRLAVHNSQPGAQTAAHAPGAPMGLGSRAAVSAEWRHRRVTPDRVTAVPCEAPGQR